MSRQERDAFTDAYIEAALWSTSDNSDEQGDDSLDKNYGPEDIDPDTLAAMERECSDFQKRFGHLIEDDESLAIDKWGRWELAGHDFWLTAAGHGAGFGDGNFPKHDDELHEAAKSYKGFDLYVGDDGVIYASGHEPSRTTEEARRPILRPRPPSRSVRQVPLRPRYAGEARRGLPTKNIFWRDIPPGSRVELVGHSYVVTLPDGTRASAYWGGQDAAVAQRTLDSMVQAWQRGQRLPLARPRHTGESRGLAKRFRVGSRVQMSDDALENYGEQHRGRVFTVAHVATSHADHPGFDPGGGSALYDLTDEAGKVFPNSLYDWELEPAPTQRKKR